MNKLKHTSLLFISIILLMFMGCKEESSDSKVQTDEKKEVIAPVEKVKIPKFNRNNAYQHIETQVNMGPRVPGSDAHNQAKDYFVTELSKYMDDVKIQEFKTTLYNGDNYNGYNIIAHYKPQLSNRILLAAHWDSRLVADHDPTVENRKKHVPGANDGASGVGVLLEIARILKEHPIEFGVDIVLFDLEDQGADGGSYPDSWCLGAQHFAKNLPISSIKYRNGILLDMVGAKNAQFPKEMVSQTFAKNFQNKVWKLADAMGYGNLFLDKVVSGVTDDHLYINRIAGIPMIDIIDKRDSEKGFFPHWHTVSDDMSNIDKSTLRAVGQVVTAVIYKSYNQDF